MERVALNALVKAIVFREDDPPPVDWGAAGFSKNVSLLLSRARERNCHLISARLTLTRRRVLSAGWAFGRPDRVALLTGNAFRPAQSFRGPGAAGRSPNERGDCWA